MILELLFVGGVFGYTFSWVYVLFVGCLVIAKYHFRDQLTSIPGHVRAFFKDPRASVMAAVTSLYASKAADASQPVATATTASTPVSSTTITPASSASVPLFFSFDRPLGEL